MNKLKNKNNNKYNVSLGFLINNLKLEGIKVPPDEELVYKNILEGNIDIDEFKKVVLYNG